MGHQQIFRPAQLTVEMQEGNILVANLLEQGLDLKRIQIFVHIFYVALEFGVDGATVLELAN